MLKINRICFVCGKSSESGKPLCNNCKPRTLNRDQICSKCGIPTSKFVKICNSCMDVRYDFISNYSFFYYQGLTKEILTQFKFKKDLSFCDFYSELIIKYLHVNFKEVIICPVPTSLIKRKIKNGYQLDSIINNLKRANFKISYLLKKRQGKNQKKLNRVDRLENMKNSYKLKKKLPHNKNIIIIDDVFTTGATINCCSILLNKNNNNIYSLTLYRD